MNQMSGPWTASNEQVCMHGTVQSTLLNSVHVPLIGLNGCSPCDALAH
jgi:hypothetical protein